MDHEVFVNSKTSALSRARTDRPIASKSVADFFILHINMTQKRQRIVPTASTKRRMRQKFQLLRISVVVLWLSVLKFAPVATVDVVINNPQGHELCPCLDTSQLSPVDTSVLPPGFNPEIDYTTFGIGCALHDANTSACSSESGAQCDSIVSGGIPLPVNDCERSWCSRPWCYVDARNCRLLHKPSSLLVNQTRFYSYATCGYMDSFTDDARLASLQGQVLRVGYNSNSGGWTGSYHPDGHFATTNEWRGPTVNFVTQAALRGGFRINVTKPPDWLIPLSQQFFGTSSTFDLCIFATTLGYLDFCVADYTITDKRAASTTFFQLQNKPLYMISFVAEKETSFDTFSGNFMSIFDPFTTAVWCLILFLVIPVMGLLMVIHEYGVQDSSFPKETSVMVTDQEGSQEIRSKAIPMRTHIVRALYASLLSFFQQAYGQRIVTLGGKFNLLGISFFILIIITIYTSNLAAILTQDARTTGINDLEDAISAGYRFCATRKAAELVMALYDIRDQIVVDPPELGGDGLPGFSCCKARQRVFDFLAKPNPNSTLYCDAAITIPENLDEFQRVGVHCNKTLVGSPIAYGLSGLPIYSAIAEPLSALFLALRNEGFMRKEIKDAQPTIKCPEPKSEGEALTVEELTAVWVITFTFAFLGLVAKFSKQCIRRRRERFRTGTSVGIVSVKSVARFDQWGPTNRGRGADNTVSTDPPSSGDSTGS